MRTIRELATKANVSIATISLVLNNKEGVGTETRRRILDLIHESGYSPKPARSPRQQKRRSLRLIKVRDSGLLIERNDEFVNRLQDGVIQAAEKFDCELSVSNLNVGAGITSFSEAFSQQDAGLIVLASEMPPSMRQLLRQLSKPYIVLDNEMHQLNDNAVTMNNEQAAYVAVNHLYALGHRRIGFITSVKPVANFIARERGLVQAAEELGFAYDKKYRLMLPYELEDAVDQVRLDGVDSPGYPTAFFAANDILALAAMRIFRRVGKRVPEDYSLVGMDNILASSISSPQLTTIKLPNETMGGMAVKQLLARLENPNEAPMKTFVGCELVIRKSTGPFAG